MPSIEIFNHEILITNKGENDNIEKKPGRQLRNQVIKCTIPRNEKLHHVPPGMMHRDGHNVTFVTLPKNA